MLTSPHNGEATRTSMPCSGPSPSSKAPPPRPRFRLADSQFHAGVVAAARSPRLEEIASQARGEFFVPTDTLVFDEQIEASVTGHAAVLEALQGRDADAARAAMADHIEDTRSHLHWLLRGNPLRRPQAR